MIASQQLLSRFNVARNHRHVISLGSRALASTSTTAAKNENSPSFAVPLVASGLLLFGAVSLDRSFSERTRLDASHSSIALEPSSKEEEEEETTDIINWSGTHQVTVLNDRLWEPETVEEVQTIVRECHAKGRTVRPLGSSLSPNGIALNKEGMISMVNLDKIIDIDVQKKTITVQAGITVSRVSMLVGGERSKKSVISNPHLFIRW
jgi:L-galactono-1,4-lactone dehydrogenase